MAFRANKLQSMGRTLKHFVYAAVCVTPCLSCSAQSSPLVQTSWTSTTATSLQAAGRLLNQATFGPVANDVFNVENIGLSNYITQQFAVPAYQIPLASPGTVVQGDCGTLACTTEYYWWNDALFGQDQLRQRVAFELSKLFVVSLDTVDPRYMPNYLNTLANDAFGNWFTLMQDVALSPAMGTYLNMANSFVPAAGQSANENYARENMQLFSIGTSALNQDGSLKLDANGNTIPNYTPAEVQNFALAFTGWTFAMDNCGVPPVENGYFYGHPPGQNCPMVPLPGTHSTAAKTLLRGTVLPADQSAQQDFTQALSNVFNDPSLPPFVSRRLIQALVRSNPSPAYISRVAGVFINNGSGVRGDMKSVLTAILMDPEARAGDVPGTPDPTGGKLRDPILWWASVMRGMSATSGASLPNVSVYESRFDLWLNDMDEQPHSPSSVFSFYSPNFQLQGTSLYAPEFQNENVYTIVWMALHMEDALGNNFGEIGPAASEFSLNLGPGTFWYQCVVNWGPTNLVNALDALLMHGTMTQDMQQAIVNAIQYDDPADMVKAAVYLIVTSPQYRVMI